MPNAMPELRVYVSVSRSSMMCTGGRYASCAVAQCLVHWSSATDTPATPTRNPSERLTRALLLFLLQPSGALPLLDVVLLLDRVARPRQRLEAGASDGLARRLADAVDAVVNAPQGVV